MTLAETPWLAAYGTAIASFVAAALCAWRLLPEAALHHAAQRDVVADLEARYGQLIAQLRDLTQQAHRLTPAALAAERSEYEGLAQVALAQLQAARQRAVQPSSTRDAAGDRTAAVGFLAARPQLRGFLWGMGGMGVAMSLFIAVQRDGHWDAPSSPPAGAAAAASAPAGPMAAGPGSQADVEEMRTLAEALRATPNDAVKLLRFAHLLLRAQMLDEARTINERALVLAPNDLEGLTHAAVLSASSGDSASADVGLDMVLKKDPTFVEAWFFRGMLALQRGDTPKVEASFTAFLQHAPPGPQRDRVAGMLERMRQAP